MNIRFGRLTKSSFLVYGKLSNPIVGVLGLDEVVEIRPLGHELRLSLVPRTLWLAFRCLLRSASRRHISVLVRSAYLATAVRKSGARLVLTAVDEAVEFYFSKGFQEEAIYVAFQNGLHDRAPMYTTLKSFVSSPFEPRVDLICSWSEAMASRYRAQIQAKVVASGSLLSNQIPEATRIESVRSLALISSYEPFGNFEAKYVPLQAMMRHHMEVVYRRIARLAEDRSIVITVLTRTQSEEEYLFFDNLLGTRFQYLQRDQDFRNLKNLDYVDAVFSCKSSLGFESLGRLKRTGIFWPPVSDDLTFHSGIEWFTGLPPTGPFWSQSSSAVEIDRVFRFVVETPYSEWLQSSGPIREHFCSYEYGNISTKNELRELLRSN